MKCFDSIGLIAKIRLLYFIFNLMMVVFNKLSYHQFFDLIFIAYLGYRNLFLYQIRLAILRISFFCACKHCTLV
jgi:hypothetical protein